MNGNVAAHTQTWQKKYNLHLMKSTDESSTTFDQSTKQNLLEYLEEFHSQIFTQKEDKEMLAFHTIHHMKLKLVFPLAQVQL